MMTPSLDNMPEYAMFGAEERANFVNSGKHALLVHYMRPQDWANVDPVTGILQFND